MSGPLVWWLLTAATATLAALIGSQVFDAGTGSRRAALLAACGAMSAAVCCACLGIAVESTIAAL